MLCATALASPAPAFQTQPESNTQVGPAEIRDFSLPGTQPPPEREPEPAETPAEPPPAEAREPVSTPAPAPTAAQPAPPREATPPAATPQPRQETATPAERRDPASEVEERLTERSDVRDGRADSPAQVPAETAPAPNEFSPAPPLGPGAGEPVQQEDEGSNWLLPILAGLALLGGAVAVLRLRRRRSEEELETRHVPTPQPEAEPTPAPAPQPVAAPLPPPVSPAPAPVAQAAVPPAAAASDVPGIVMRPWLELIFRPARATATDGGASVQYEAVIRNVGNAPARNVRLAARMFNSGQDIQAEVSRFFGMGVDSPDGAPLTILPRTEVSLSSVVTMEREDMREIKVQGRSLFIPTVAFNLLYEWGRDKVGQTCSAHLVGREPDTPSEKMAPFRLDLGPRVYRSVGQRPSALARAV
ncbi:hypothetical protein [Allosphingosinicella sp.]|jgi:hypothetical protein|uniref:hypothetical protein n=1 Tax=Allosphingosinicella sp. TaxID=2823234 RepID=UPI003D73046C